MKVENEIKNVLIVNNDVVNELEISNDGNEIWEKILQEDVDFGKGEISEIFEKKIDENEYIIFM